MSKPLELTIYPKLERPRTGAEIMPHREQWQREHALMQDKHLSDAELAAEVWHECNERTINASNILGGQYDNPYAQRAFQQSIERANILHRFATLPHYDEIVA